jgi:hypothetical protein
MKTSQYRPVNASSGFRIFFQPFYSVFTVANKHFEMVINLKALLSFYPTTSGRIYHYHVNDAKNQDLENCQPYSSHCALSRHTSYCSTQTLATVPLKHGPARNVMSSVILFSAVSSVFIVMVIGVFSKFSARVNCSGNCIAITVFILYVYKHTVDLFLLQPSADEKPPLPPG